MRTATPQASWLAWRPRGWQVTLFAVLVADVTFGFQQTAITPALPAVERDLHASETWTAWVLSGYLIVAAMSPTFLGKVADRSGKKRVFLGALVAFLLGSVGAAVSPNIGVLVACRALQGVGGVVFPLSFSIARDVAPPGRVAGAIGVLSGALGIGAIAGYGLGGLVAELLSWRWIFGIGAVAVLGGIVSAAVALPPSPTRRTRLDTAGALLFGGALACLLLALTEGPNQGWGAPLVVASGVASVLLAGGFVARELRTASPLMDLRVLTSRPVLATNAASLLSGYVIFGVNLLIPFLVVSQTGLAVFGLAAGPLATGLLLLPRAFGQAVAGPIAGPLQQRFGPAATFCAAMLLMTVGSLGLAFARQEPGWVLLETAILGVGFGLSVSVSGAVVTRSAAASETGVAAALNSVLRRTGGGIGAQASAALIAVALLTGQGQAFTVAFLAAAGAGVLGAVAAAMSRTH